MMTTVRASRGRLRTISRESRHQGQIHRSLPGVVDEAWSGAALRNLRKQLMATQGELAQILGVAASSVHRWEAERVAPDRRSCEKLSSLKEVSRLLDKHFKAEGRVRFFTMPQSRLDGDRPMDLLG